MSYSLGCELEGYTIQKPANLLQDIRKPRQLHNQPCGARLSHEKQGESQAPRDYYFVQFLIACSIQKQKGKVDFVMRMIPMFTLVDR